MKRTTFLSLAAALLLPLAANAQPTVDFVLTNGIIEPHSIAFAGESKFFITDAATHRVLSFDSDNGLLSVFAGASGQAGSANGPGFLARFISPKGIVAVPGGLVVADSGNHILRFLTTTGSVSVVSTFAGTVGQPGLVDGPANAARFNNPVGLAADAAGNIYVADAKNNAIRRIDHITTNVVTLSTAFSEPNGVALDETGRVFVADTRNNAIKLIEPGNVVSLLAGSANKVAGTNDSYFATEALFNAPNALLWVGGSTGLLVSDTGGHTVRRVYYNDVVASFFPQLNGYSVETYAGTPNQPGFVDGAVLSAKFNTPIGLARNTEGGLVLADLGNRALRHIQTTPRLPKVKNPVVGFVTFFYDTFSGRYVSSLTGFTNIVFNNDPLIQIRSEPNTETFYTLGSTPNLFEADTIPAPNSQNSLSAPFYQDGMGTDEVKPSIISPSPDITLKIISSSDGRRPSDVLRARAQFKASAPNILGDNPASFAVSCDTTNAAIWYTLDGSTPTNQAPSIEAVTGSISIITDTSFVFRARAFRNNYKPSEITTKSFSATDFQANRISFGFHHGEASSDFVASPGQRFYAPVTLSVLPQVKMYSLQFNVLVTNLASAPAVTPGAVGFQSTLREEIPVGSRKFRVIPPAMFITSSDPPPTGSTILHGGVPFQSLLVTNSALNLIGVGWLERGGTDKTNLFNTIAQDLITYSQPHDTLFLKTGSKVVAGAYSFVVPSTAGPGDTYQITLGRASATSDGIGGPGGDVYIDMPTNGSLGSGSINSLKDVIVGQRRYIVGDVAPFRWFNAGDFGNTNLFSDDVLQVFQSAIYSINQPIPGSDFADAMDSCCADFAAVPGASYVVHGPNTFTGSAENPFFDGNDASINNIAFGDGTLDVTDVYVTFRRALDPSLTWYERFWTNGVLAAQAVPNLFRGKPNLPAEEYTNAGSLADTDLSATELPSASFTAPDLIVTGGQTLSVPITAQITGRYAAHICMLNLELEPLDGSPDLMEAVEFLPNPSLGQPTLSSSHGIGNYGAAWLERGIMGLKGRTQMGMLRVKLPPNLPPNAAYRLRFEHISASPNGLVAFPKNAQDGLLLASARNDSSFSDGIPDTWRLRHFGSTANLLSHANADADGDGVPNWAEFKAGTNPVDERSNIRMNAQHRSPNHRGIVLRWPTAKGKTYAIEAASSVTSRGWTPVAPNVIGTGFEMEFAPMDDDTTEQFYRVRLVE